MDKYNTIEHMNYKDELGDEEEMADYPLLMSSFNLNAYLDKHHQGDVSGSEGSTSIHTVNIIGENILYTGKEKPTPAKNINTRVAASIAGGVLLTAIAGLGMKMMGRG